MKAMSVHTGKVVFGQYMVHRSQVFYRSEWSLALVNLMPVKPGHVLVIPKRKVHRFKDLIPQEVSDLFLSAQKISSFLETYSSASTLALQDGPDAGQTVFHCHVHIIPRHPNDFKRNDDVYQEIEKPREKRTEDDMANEAQNYAKHFPEIENFDFVLTADQEKLVDTITNKHDSGVSANV